MKHLVGGISSAGRALPDMGEQRPIIVRAQGAWLWNENGERYLDTALGFGAALLGHNHPAVVDAMKCAIDDMMMPAFPHALEEEAAGALSAFTGDLNKVVFVNSGSEAVHLAIRAARAATGRRRIVKFAAGYDGWFENVAFGHAGSTEAAMAGQRPEKDDTLLLRYNDARDVDALFARYPDIAAVIIEPMMANAGCIEPEAGYLAYLAAQAHRNGAKVVLDEVLMGFRLHCGLYGHALGLDADYATVGKAIGNGAVVAALVGKQDAMAVFEDGRAVRAGTYSGNPPVCAAVIATLNALKQADYPALLQRGDALRNQVAAAARQAGKPFSSTGFGTVFTFWPRDRAPRDYGEAAAAVDRQWTLDLHRGLRARHIFMMPPAFGRFYLSFSHDSATVEQLAQSCAAVIIGQG
ncbi:aminotransferase class III-fold pyridoxal phosphate-dependent enzyme [Martelella alba]|uniref:Aminotransferase class III-fold pyridoxal phosphate-dependent enzyme n=1 Tax=Martelella alba TaxID=2590451 RepID=A0ABY2SJU8_9HYPH|nr:aminotransferase class III-fold pyridoxal phosphate-dependent enzyme [Martelella alba]TKI05200.1 aminotransferase class III-fold pyridoxal phosphate-dependent enzyme [Martelella alba]